MKNQRGLSILEIIMSIGFLTGLVIVCLNIFKKQQIEMLNAIQKIEITSTVNIIRTTLKNEEACMATFEDKKIGSKDIKVVKKVIHYPETEEIEEIEAFPLYQYGKKTFGTHGLKISSFRLAEYKENKIEEERALRFIIGFDKNIPDYGKKNNVTREVRIYAHIDELGRIESCGLSKSSEQGQFFKVADGGLYKEKGGLGFGTKLIPSKLSVAGGVQFLPMGELKCPKNEMGSLIYSRKLKDLAICYSGSEFSLGRIAVEGL